MYIRKQFRRQHHPDFSHPTRASLAASPSVTPRSGLGSLTRPPSGPPSALVSGLPTVGAVGSPGGLGGYPASVRQWTRWCSSAVNRLRSPSDKPKSGAPLMLPFIPRRFFVSSLFFTSRHPPTFNSSLVGISIVTSGYDSLHIVHLVRSVLPRTTRFCPSSMSHASAAAGVIQLDVCLTR
ncbi:hypothetical protein TgHK011_003342 [Trichoderma gracile]|nr:hypothetical protein TgHK011_003342 [Trichoderma gracile]